MSSLAVQNSATRHLTHAAEPYLAKHPHTFRAQLPDASGHTCAQTPAAWLGPGRLSPSERSDPLSARAQTSDSMLDGFRFSVSVS